MDGMNMIRKSSPAPSWMEIEEEWMGREVGGKGLEGGETAVGM